MCITLFSQKLVSIIQKGLYLIHINTGSMSMKNLKHFLFQILVAFISHV